MSKPSYIIRMDSEEQWLFSRSVSAVRGLCGLLNGQHDQIDTREISHLLEPHAEILTKFSLSIEDEPRAAEGGGQ